jgi:nitrate reductase beta subunit
MGTLITLLILAGIVWFWLDSTRTKEIAVQASAQACREIGVQWLDQTVSIGKIKPVRNAKGRLILMRIYEFDFTLDGTERLQGRAVMYGQTVKQIHLDKPDGMVIEQSPDK